jgi:hypothetical protein
LPDQEQRVFSDECGQDDGLDAIKTMNAETGQV